MDDGGGYICRFEDVWGKPIIGWVHWVDWAGRMICCPWIAPRHRDSFPPCSTRAGIKDNTEADIASNVTRESKTNFINSYQITTATGGVVFKSSCRIEDHKREVSLDRRKGI